MRTFFRIWGGHIVAVIAVALIFLCMYFAWVSFSSDDYARMWWFFIAAALSFLLGIAVGMIASYLYNNWHERRYIRNEVVFARSVLGGLKEAGGPATRYRRTTAADGRTAPEREGNE